MSKRRNDVLFKEADDLIRNIKFYIEASQVLKKRMNDLFDQLEEKVKLIKISNDEKSDRIKELWLKHQLDLYGLIRMEHTLLL